MTFCIEAIAPSSRPETSRRPLEIVAGATPEALTPNLNRLGIICSPLSGRILL
jgi:hypothetical protein